MIELEKTYLAKNLPENLKECKSKEIIDIYIPKESEHPKLRIRKDGEKYEATKKMPVNDGDASHMLEQTIILTREEFDVLNTLEAKKVRKERYYFEYRGNVAEVDVFKDELEGLVLVDFEFETIPEKDAFQMPDFCLADVTQEVFIAGGMICGKTYEDIEADLARFEYKKLMV